MVYQKSQLGSSVHPLMVLSRNRVYLHRKFYQHGKQASSNSITDKNPCRPPRRARVARVMIDSNARRITEEDHTEQEALNFTRHSTVVVVREQ